ncbi:MAG: phosphate ABC transporter permease PstA [Acidimicrobiales bacterium]|nr:phosphate ABC transporter permease PstA [Acidimicrobiales bacterium]
MAGLDSPELRQESDRLLLEATTSRSRSVKNRVASVWMAGSLVVAVIPLAFVIYYVVAKGIGVIDWAWFTEDIQARTREAGGGMAPAIVGTLVITGLATLMSVPLGILGAIYLNEYGGKGRMASIIRFMSDVMTGVPSIVMGLFVYTVWTLTFGLSAFGGALALGCLMLPIVIRSTEEMLRLVPEELRHGSYALGNRKWRTIMTVVLPAAFGGIVSGAMLAVARAAGETAPLLFTIGAARAVNLDVFGGATTALSVQIFTNAQSPFQPAIDRAWASALTLVVIVFIFTIAARVVSARVARRHAA